MCTNQSIVSSITGTLVINNRTLSTSTKKTL